MSDIRLVVNNYTLAGDQAVVDQQGVYYVALREMFAVLGAHISWHEAAKQAIVRWSNHLIIVPAGSTALTLNGEKKLLAYPNLIINKRLYMPLYSFAEAIGGTLRKASEHSLLLFLPVARLVNIKLDGNSVYFGLSSQGVIEPHMEGSTISIGLLDSGWPTALRRLSVERQDDGSLRAEVETSGDSFTHTTAEQGIRLSWKEAKGELAGLVFALDAGHGGSDPGAVGPRGLQEKDVALSITKGLSALLKSEGAQVIETRPQDQRITLEERVRLSRQGGAHAFVSIHLNGYSRSEANGTETFCSANNKLGEALASVLQRQLMNSLRLRDRGVKHADFYVLRTQAEIPSVLLEIAFITNPEEEQLLSSSSTQLQVAEAIFHGLVNFAKSHRSLLVD